MVTGTKIRAVRAWEAVVGADDKPLGERIEQGITELSRSAGMSEDVADAAPKARRRDKEMAPAAMPAETPDAEGRLIAAIAWIESRKIRDRVLGEDLFFDPAWSILLELYVYHRRDTAVALTTLCAGSGLPPSTGLRWVTLLERRGLVSREPDTFDRRKTYARLTELAVQQIERTLDGAADVGHGLGIERARRVN